MGTGLCKKVSLVCVLMTSAVIAYAGNEDGGEKSHPTTVSSSPQKKVTKKTTSTEDSSQSNEPEDSQAGKSRRGSYDIRERTTATVGLTSLNVGLFHPVVYSGLFVAYHYSGSLQLGASVREASFSSDRYKRRNGYYTDDITRQENYLSAGAYGRYFLRNSFNMAAGLGFYQSVLKYSVTNNLSDDFSGKVTLNSLVLPFSIGNLWTLNSRLTLGCDWIGFILPLWGQASGRVSGPVSNADADTINKRQLGVAKADQLTMTVTYLSGSLGWAF